MEPLVSCGVDVAANQVAPLFVDICHVSAEFQLPFEMLLNSSFAANPYPEENTVRNTKRNAKLFFMT